MKMLQKKHTLWGVWLCLLLHGMTLAAQNEAKTVVTADSSAQPPFKSHIVLGIGAGAQALFGADLAYQFSKKLAIRAGYSYFALSQTGIQPDLSSFSLPKGKLTVGGNVDQSNLNLGVEFMPTRKGRIRLFAGASYLPNLNYTATVKYNESVVIGDIVVTPDEIGTMTLKYTTKSPVAPFLGVGFGRLTPRKRVGLNLDLGAAYRGAPQVEVIATKLLVGNSENGPILTRNAQPYQWYPLAHMRLTIRLN